MRVYYDWEFLEDGRTIAPISVGMRAENGDTLYRIVNDGVTIGRACTDPWLRENVVPALPVKLFPDTWQWDMEHRDLVSVRTRDQIASDVKHFVLSHGPDVQLWSWFGAYDHVVLAQLFGRMVDLPQGFPMYTGDLQQEIVRLGLDNRTHLLPQQLPGATHDAAADAAHHEQLGRFLQEFELAQVTDPSLR